MVHRLPKTEIPTSVAGPIKSKIIVDIPIVSCQK